MALQQVIHNTVTGLGYDLVEIKHNPGGLLRVTIDLIWSKERANNLAEPQSITVEDCEKVTRQLQFALEVDGVSYQRLEVSSPGIDRLLRHEQDFERFVGETIDITLKEPLGEIAQGQVHASRKKFRGVLESVESVDANSSSEATSAARWQIVWSEPPPAKPGAKISKKREQAVPLHALGFTLDELRDARLASIVDFKGRKFKDAAAFGGDDEVG